MSDQIAIVVNDRATADAIQREFASNSIHFNRLSPNQAIQFGMKLSKGRGSFEVSPKEIIELVSAAPDVVDALFDILERFRERIRVVVNGELKEVPKKTSLTRKPTFEEFVRGK